jgi:hypothetical protein
MESLEISKILLSILMEMDLRLIFNDLGNCLRFSSENLLEVKDINLLDSIKYL